MTYLPLAVAFLLGLALGALVVWALMRTSTLKQTQALLTENKTLTEQAQWLSAADTKLHETFEALASKALKDNADQLTREAKTQLEGITKQFEGKLDTQDAKFKGVVEPVKSTLDKLNHELQSIETKREGAYKGLETEVKQLQQAYKDLHTVTMTLNSALRSSQTRGKWGELQLRRIAELAGMVDKIDFEEQVGSESRPDMIVHLPNSAILPVDAKAPMNAYLDSVDAQSQDIADTKLEEHARALRSHMKALSRKEYWQQFKRAPEFVVMLVPYDPGISTAFTRDPTLFDDALASKVLIVSPASLLALLKVIAYGWLQLQLADNAQRIAEQGRDLYTRLSNFTKHLSDIGGRIDQTVKTYNSAVGSFESRILPSVRKLRDMGAGVEDIEIPPPVESQSRLVTPPDHEPTR